MKLWNKCLYIYVLDKKNFVYIVLNFIAGAITSCQESKYLSFHTIVSYHRRPKARNYEFTGAGTIEGRRETVLMYINMWPFAHFMMEQIWWGPQLSPGGGVSPVPWLGYYKRSFRFINFNSWETLGRMRSNNWQTYMCYLICTHQSFDMNIHIGNTMCIYLSNLLYTNLFIITVFSEDVVIIINS